MNIKEISIIELLVHAGKRGLFIFGMF